MERRLPKYGIKGYCPILSLPYVSYNNIMVVPTYHMLLYGILNKFWNTVLSTQAPRVLSRESLKIMDGRVAGLVRTNDFKNPYNNIVHRGSKWKLYDWTAWAEVWFYFVMQGLTLEGVLPTKP